MRSLRQQNKAEDDLNLEELLLMDEDERREVLEAAGFDPDDFAS